MAKTSPNRSEFSPESLEMELAALPSLSSWTAPPPGPRWGLDLSLLAQSGTRREAGSCRSASSGCKPPMRKVRCPTGPQCPSTPSCWCTATREGLSVGDKEVLSAVLLYIEFDYICTDSMRVHHRTLRSSYSQILPKLIPNVKPGTPGPAPTSRKPPRSLVKM